MSFGQNPGLVTTPFTAAGRRRTTWGRRRSSASAKPKYHDRHNRARRAALALTVASGQSTHQPLQPGKDILGVHDREQVFWDSQS
jgi:hypothetical protein